MGILKQAFGKSLSKTNFLEKNLNKNMALGITPNNRGQMQIQETILVVFIFVVLIIFGMVFFYRVQEASIADDFNKFQRERLVIDFITLGDLPEFGCSRAGIRENCIDTSKLVVFKDIARGSYKDYYFERFGYRNITIQQIYPNKISTECSLQRGTNCGIWNVYSKIPNNWGAKEVRDIPVSLYFPCSESGCEDEYYTIGVMTVEDYYA